MKFRSHKPITRWMAMLVIASLSLPVAQADKKKKKGEVGAPKKVETIDHSQIDIRKLVWPLPPDIARIKFVKELYGEQRPDPIPGQESKKKKQSWMDRVAGLPTTDSGAIKHDVIHRFAKPYGMGTDSQGRLYVADGYVAAVFVMDLEKKETKMLRNGAEGKFGTVIGLTVDDVDRVFVVDALMHRVAVFDKDLKLETYFGEKELEHPGGCAIDEQNRFLYVVDTNKHLVAVFDADTFKYLRAIGGPAKKEGDDEPGTLSKPSNVAVDKDGLVYVSDTMNNRVQIFDADGAFVSMFGKHGDGPGDFARPKGIAIDSDGHIWVVDAYTNRVQVFDKEGHMTAYLGGGGELPGQFSVPSGIFIDKQNRVYVAEQFKARVQIFQYVTDAQAKAEEEKRGKKTPEGTSAQLVPATAKGSK
jgi:DNA-binding beta-propeller fold protein YncE